MDLSNPPPKCIYVKLTPGTPLFNKVVKVAEHLGEPPTQAARRLIKAGWIGFARSLAHDIKKGKI